MQDVPDLDFDKPSEDSSFGSPEPQRSLKPWLIGAAVVAVLALAGYYFLGSRAPESIPADDSLARSLDDGATPAAEPLGGEPLTIILPSLDQSDAMIREFVGALSSHPQVAAWLVTRGLARNVAAVVNNVAEGTTPAIHLQKIRPSQRFEVIERGDDLLIDPRSYERYAPVTAAVSSLDVDGTAQLYATVKPLLEQASRELGNQEGFDRTLQRAIARLLSTPVPGDAMAVAPHGIVYAFEDPRIEGLSPAQKLLLRFGPRNVRVIQDTLRSLAAALGIPPQTLPAQTN